MQSNVSDSRPAGDSQRALWTFYKLSPESSAYNMAYAAELRRDIDLQRLREAFSHVVLGHEALCSGYSEDESGLQMYLPAEVTPDMTVLEVDDWSHDQVSKWLEAEADRPFEVELGRVCRFRALVVKGKEARRIYLCIGLHHIAGDFLAFELFGESVFRAYEQLGRGEPLYPLNPGLYWRWLKKQEQVLSGSRGETLAKFWREQLSEEFAAVELATDYPKQKVHRYRGEELAFELDETVTRQLKALAKQLDISLFGMLGAMFQVFLHRYSGRERFLIGTPTSGRSGAEFEGLVGYTLNAIPWQTDLRGNPTFAKFAQSSYRVLRAGLRRQRYPLSRISGLASGRDGQGPLFKHMTTLIPRHERPSADRCVVREFFATQRGAANEINLRWQDAGDRMIAQWRYDSDLFRRDTAERMLTGFQLLIDNILQAPDTRIGALCISSPEHSSVANAPVVQGNRQLGGSDKTALAAFERHVRQTPARIAVVDGDEKLSYEALDAQAAGLSVVLRDSGLRPGDRLALLIPRSAQIVVAMLAAWKAGAAYVCLDPAFPAQRLTYMIEDSGASILLGTGKRPDWLGDTHWINLAGAEFKGGVADAANPSLSSIPTESLPAYLIYTSGSTGKPKGVVVSQANLLHYVSSVLAVLDLPQEASLCALASVATDLGYTAWFGALLSGRTLHVISDDLASDPEMLAQRLSDVPVDCLKIVPSHLKALLAVTNPQRLLPLRCLVLGGEALGQDFVQRIGELAPTCRVINHYGPTETTVGCLTHVPNRTASKDSTIADMDVAGADAVPIGTPLDGGRAVVLDPYLSPLPHGAIGELAIGGPGVATGYLERPGLTAERFVPDPSARDGGRLYRTGDRAQMFADGSTKFLGRLDDQVKIRGFRVELGEVEAWLRQRPELADAVVMARPMPQSDGLRLIAYVVSATNFSDAVGASFDFAALRIAMDKSLPDAMVPSSFVRLDELPRMANGKVDRQALPDPVDRVDTPDTQDGRPRNSLEETLVYLWVEVLGQPEISIHDNFFELGGDSIIGLQMVAKARQSGLQLHPKQIFEHPTIADLAGALDESAVKIPGRDTPEQHIEAVLTSVWKDVLEREVIDRDADFFELGGDSILALQAIAKTQAQGIKLTPKVIFEHRSIAALARVISANEAPTLTLAKPESQQETKTEPFALSGLTPSQLEVFRTENADLEDAYPLSPLQQGLLFHSLFDAESGSYVNQLVVEAVGRFEPDLFAASWQDAVDSHPILRTTFQWDALDAPLQSIQREASLPVSFLDWRDLDDNGRAAALQTFCANDRMVGFSLSQAPLMRLTVARLDAAHWYLIWSRHHLVVDGWCSVMLLEEVLERYRASLAGEVPQLVQRSAYRNYIDWLSRQDRTRAVEFWKNRLDGVETATALPFVREATRGAIEPIKHRLVLDEETTNLLHEIAQKRQVTLSTLLQAAWGIVLSGLSGEDDVLFGVTSAGRPPELIGAEHILGVFINTLPLRLKPLASLSLEDYLTQVQSDNLALREFEYSSLADIQAEAVGGAALFDTIMVFQNLSLVGQRQRELDGLELRQLENIEQTHYGITLEVMPETTMIIEFTADRRRISDENLTRMAGFLSKTLRDFTDPALIFVGDIELPDESEFRLIRDHGQSAADYSLAPDWVTRVAAQAHNHPHHVVARCGDVSMSYRELWQRSGALAQGLNANAVGPDSLVALLFPRGLDLLTAMLAVLRAGGAWLPLDPTHPPARWAQVLEQAGSPLLLCAPEFCNEFSDSAAIIPLTCRDLLAAAPEGCLPAEPARGDQLAYVIFTSGSTGTPKGAMVTRDGMLNNMLAKVDPLGLTEGDVIAQTASACFDISVWQTLTAPLLGACVEIIPDDVVRDPEALLGVLQSRQVSLFEPVPSLLQALLDIQVGQVLPLPALRWVLPTGEALPSTCVQAWFDCYPDVPLMNAYGPAECADDVAFYPLYQAPAAGEAVPIGRPTANADLYIVNSDRRCVPVGVTGEIAVGGVGVGRGYLADPRRTAASFVPNHDGPPGSRLYLTGDLGRWRDDGAIIFAGRNDFQVKIRGYRIEPGEIEALLEKADGLKRALVTVNGQEGREQLVAYWEPSSNMEEGLEQRLSKSLAEQLPSYMVPTAWVRIAHWPLNANGKIDQRSLPRPLPVQDQIVAAQTDTESCLIQIWREILPEIELGRESDFFACGGHSLLATRLVARLRREGFPGLPLRTVFDAPTVRTLAEALDRINFSSEHDEPSLIPVQRTPIMPLSLAQQRLWLVDRLSAAGAAAYNMTATLRLRGALNVSALQKGFDRLLARHEVLRTGYPEVDGEPGAAVMTNVELKITVTDLSALASDAQEPKVRDAERTNAEMPFDVSDAPLLRARLLRLDSENHLLLFAMHHLVADGWSVGVMVNELAAAYRFTLGESLSGSPDMLLPSLPVQYADYAVWQRSLLAGPRLESEEAYWRQVLDGVPTRLELPLDRPRPKSVSHDGGAVPFTISASLLENVEEFAQSRGATTFMVLLTSFQLFLHRLTRSNDIIIGTDTAGRIRSELEDLIGFFVNVLPLRSRIQPGVDFGGLLELTRQVSLDAFEHEALPFDRIVEAVGAPRDRSFNPLVQALFVFQNVPEGHFDLPGLQVEMLPQRERYSKFDMALFLEPSGSELKAEWVYATALFDQSTIRRFAGDWLVLLKQVLAAPQTPIVDFALPIRQEAVQMDHTRRMSAKLDKLKKIARPGNNKTPGNPASTPAVRSPIRTSFLKPSSSFPIVIEPATQDIDPVAWARDQRLFVEKTLRRHAAILFRNFEISTPQDFESFAEAIEPGLFGSYGDLPKKEGGKNIYRSTPYPERQMILYHNESSHLERWPRKQLFFCEQAAPVGGATPIVDCREMLRFLPAELVEEFEHKQLKYIRTFTKRLDVGWRQFFMTDDKAEVEARCRKAGTDCRWLDDETLQTRTLCPAVIRHPITLERSFFNQVQLHHIACLAADVRTDLMDMVGPERMPRQVVYGDDSPIPDSVMALIGEAYEACAVRFAWQPGDIVMLDNMLAAHARDPFAGPRKIVVAMGDMVERADIVDPDRSVTREPILQE